MPANDPSSQQSLFESRFKAIFEQSPFSIQLVSNNGRTLLVNPAFKKLWGISDEFVSNYILKQYNILEDKLLKESGQLELFQRAFAGEIIQMPEIYYDPAALGFEGTARWAGGILYPLKRADGSVYEVVIIHQDVTNQKQAESVRNFMAEVNSIMLSTLDYDKIVLEITAAAIPFLADGCMLDIIEGDEIKRVVTKHRDPSITALMQELAQKFQPTLDSPQPTGRVLRSGKPEILSHVDSKVIKEHTKNSEHMDLITRIGIRSNITLPLSIRGKIIGALNLLITTQRARFTEQDLETAMEIGRHAAVAIENARLYQNAQNAIKLRDEFISSASHEFKTPITTLNLQMKVLSTILKEVDTADANHARKVIGDTNQQLSRLTRLVDDMLDISRIDTGKLRLKLQQADLVRITQEVMERFSEQIERLKIMLKVILPEQLDIYCDPYRIDQVITNLMTNAIRHGHGSPITLSLQQSDGMALLKVQDEGPGIKKQDQGRIFNRFERVSESQDTTGLGLGLYISREIMQEHQGWISIESEPDKGSTFIIHLPVRSVM